MTIDEARARQLEAEGAKEKALKAWTMLGKYKEAARVAWELRLHAEAADLALKGGLYYEAAMCFVEGRDIERAFNCLLRVRFDHPRFRESCVRAAQIAVKSGRVDVRLDSFLGPWFRDAPRDAGEMDVLVDLGRLYAKQGYVDIAMSAFSKVAARDAHYKDAAVQLEALKAGRPLPHSTPPMPKAQQSTDSRSGELLSEEEFERIYSSAESTLIRRFAQPDPVAEPPPAKEESAPHVVDKDVTAIAALGPGAVVGGGRYTLRERLGKGAMAVVFRATDEELRTEVALKIFTAVLQGEEAEERFRREVQVSRQLAHPNIVRVFDIGRLEKHKFMTMELLSGSDVQTILNERKRLPLPEGIGILIQLCAGLEHAHAQNIVHRDVKPGNLFRTDDGVLKIMDFGIAKQRHAKGLTMTGQFMGTPEYMAPEQITDFANAQFSSDLYAVGVMAYELFTGELPFSHPELMALLMMQMTEQPKPPSALNPLVPPALDDAILKLIAKAPAQRFASAADLAGELEIILAMLDP